MSESDFLEKSIAIHIRHVKEVDATVERDGEIVPKANESKSCCSHSQRLEPDHTVTVSEALPGHILEAAGAHFAGVI